MDAAEFADAFFEQQMGRLQVPGAAIVVVQGDRVLYCRGYGWADLEKRIPLTGGTILRAGSVSKLFTATALLQLHERGRLDLHADVNTYLTRFQVHAPGGEPVTAAHLLTHTAGLEENYLGMHAHTAKGLVPLGDFLARHLPPFAEPPGTIISYNDHGYSLAGYLVEVITGQPFAQYVAESILEPLGMASSTLDQPAPPALLERLAAGYRCRRGGYHAYPLDYVNVAPAAGLLASAEDMAHFVIAHLNGGTYRGRAILAGETLELMHSRQFTHHPRLRGRAYGFSEWLENGQRALFHDGGTPGFLSRLFLLPAQQVGFYLALNADQQDRAAQLPRLFTTAFLNRFYPQSGSDAAPPVPAAGSAARARRYAGYYREQAGYSSRTLSKLAWVPRQLPVRAKADGTLRIGGEEAVEVEPRVLRWRSVSAYAVFGEKPSRQSGYLFFGTGAFRKVSWWEARPVLLGLAALFLAGFLGMLLTAACGRELGALARGALGAAGLLNLALLAGMALALRFTDQWDYFYGLPARVKGLLAIPFLTTPLAAVLLAVAGMAWSGALWTPALRCLVTSLALLGAGFIPFLAYWNLLGFRQR